MTWAWHNPVPVAHDHPPHPGLDLIARLESVFAPLLQRIAACHALLPLLLPLACARLMRARARITAILTAVAEGTWQAPRPNAGRGAATRTPRTTLRKRTPTPYLPRRKGWLGHVTDHHVRAHASQLTHLLTDPGTQAILARAPATARAALIRALRGPTRLLGLDLPSQLQLPGPPRPPRIRKQRLPSPRTCGGLGPQSGPMEGGVASHTQARLLPTDHPIPRNALAFARYNRRRFGKGG
jgi:hypothetical protein